MTALLEYYYAKQIKIIEEIVELQYIVVKVIYILCIEDDDPGVGGQLDPYELLPAVNVLGQLPSDFEENIVRTCVKVVCMC